MICAQELIPAPVGKQKIRRKEEQKLFFLSRKENQRLLTFYVF